MPTYPTPTEEDQTAAETLLLSSKRAAISVLPDAEPTAQDAPYTSSYFGGLPFLPEGVAWPSLSDGEMTFVAQITLQDLPQITGSPLPSRGRLLFFTRTNFDEANEPEDCAVIFDPGSPSGSPSPPPPTLHLLGGSERRERPPGLHPGVELRYAIRFSPIDSFARWHKIPRHPILKLLHFINGQNTEITPEEAAALPEGSIVIEMMADHGITGVEMAFHDVLKEVENNAMEAAWPDVEVSSIHQMLGYGINIQREAEQNEDNILLLQLYWEPFVKGWLSDGALNFWIKPGDLQKRDFSKAFTTAEWT